MHVNHMQGDNPPTNGQAPNPHSSKLTESNNSPFSFTKNPSLQNRILPPLPFHLKKSEVFSEENTVRPSMNTSLAKNASNQPRPSPKSLQSPQDDPSIFAAESLEFCGSSSGSTLSIDDADVRLAAEALGDLRADFIISPQKQRSSISTYDNEDKKPEPLLSLLTTSHPLIGNAIGGSLSAYSASKKYSPRFKSSVEYVERRFTPVVNTVGSVGRLTGVEGGVRWILGGRNSHQALSESKNCLESSNKRRRLDEDNIEGSSTADSSSAHWRRYSQGSISEGLPLCDELRSPIYEQNQALVTTGSKKDQSLSTFSWQSRLVLSTSGLSISMSEESLRSLKYCLSTLRWANEHIRKVILALRSAIEQYDLEHDREVSAKKTDEKTTLQNEAKRISLNTKITELKQDVLKTLKDVVDTVSKYAGGALPENARVLVRRHLTSLPQRFCIANSKPTDIKKNINNVDLKTVEGGRRVLLLAGEGLDMMAQVSCVLNSTIMSAEDWCERLGRSSRAARESEHDNTATTEKLPPEI
ncbi:Clock-controlled protein 8 [Golovinomyces cichoracearum]|uniref:Clock-controlled protein 8 n=1 Tax=Golovinomyces cichoracearum TaxID=62708 RepID=A0A420HZI2_9PEZI|nr:Clock-controlled protein 8 [Golovinomyces cichoracearum]